MKLITTEEIESLYKDLSIADKMATVFCFGDITIYSDIIVKAVVKAIGQLGVTKQDDPDFNFKDFKEDLTEGLNACLENKEIVSEYGELWLAKDETMIEMLELIGEAIYSNVTKHLEEEFQAKYN